MPLILTEPAAHYERRAKLVVDVSLLAAAAQRVLGDGTRPLN